MQTEVLLTGIGGQGVQLAAKTLALAATAEGRQVMMSSQYGGEMRGGQTEASVVIADGPLRSVPIIESAGVAAVLHPRYWPGVRARLRPGATVVFHRGVGSIDPGDFTVHEVDAAEIAAGVGAPGSAGFVVLGALAALTGLAATESLVDAMRELVPPYRSAAVAGNEAALRAGAAAMAGAA